MSGDPEQEYFSDGITEDIITGLSAFRSLFVIARNSTFTYKGKAVVVTQVARELGVRYVMEGSVRKAGNRVRITAQLIDASNGHHVWAERYDRELDDVFAVQDEITERVVATVVPALDQAEQERAARKSPDNMDTWDYYQRGLWHMNRRQLSEFPAAREYFRQAIRQAPRSPLGYCGLAYLGSREAMIAMHGPESDLLKEIDEAARTAVALDELDAMGHVVMGWSKMLMRETLLAIPEFERAVQLNPNHALSHSGLAAALILAGRVEEGIRATETALRLSPRDPDRPFWQMTTAAGLFVTERYETALAELDVVLGQHPRWAFALTLRAANLSALGKLDHASALIERVHEILPNFKPSNAILVFPFMDDTFLDKLRVALEGADWEWR
jgi:adenylate cyclase